MSKYLIHAVPKRMWYVNDFLIPSLVNQGIPLYDISVYCDDKNEGNLKAFVNSLKTITEDTWHLQDDVIISSRFGNIAQNIKEGVVCGFCSSYSENEPSGTVKPRNMWYSFPCIRIPKEVSDQFLEWLENEAPKNSTYKNWITANRFDDSLFMEFMKTQRYSDKVLNLNPNIVDHVDYLIGGSIVNKIRDSEKSKSLYFIEPELVEDLRRKLNG